jgi:hypothetical protein
MVGYKAPDKSCTGPSCVINLEETSKCGPPERKDNTENSVHPSSFVNLNTVEPNEIRNKVDLPYHSCIWVLCRPWLHMCVNDGWDIYCH